MTDMRTFGRRGISQPAPDKQVSSEKPTRRFRSTLFALPLIALPLAFYGYTAGFELPSFTDQCSAIHLARSELNEAYARTNKLIVKNFETLSRQMDHQEYMSALNTQSYILASNKQLLKKLDAAKSLASEAGDPECADVAKEFLKSLDAGRQDLKKRIQAGHKANEAIAQLFISSDTLQVAPPPQPLVAPRPLMPASRSLRMLNCNTIGNNFGTMSTASTTCTEF